MSRPKDHVSRPSAPATPAALSMNGSRPEPAATRMIPWDAATVLRARLGGSAPRSHGAAQDAATNAYRMPPMASVHTPSENATCTLSTRIRNASTSMSKRAPYGDEVRVRRATLPSTPSSTSATDATATKAGPAVVRPATRATTIPTSTARASVTRSAGPRTWRERRRLTARTVSSPAA